MAGTRQLKALVQLFATACFCSAFFFFFVSHSYKNDEKEGILHESITKLENLMQPKDSETFPISEQVSIDDIVNKLSISDLIASVWFKKDTSDDLRQEILHEKRLGLRDRYFIPNSYITHPDNYHFDDVPYQHGMFQEEVYLLAKYLLQQMSKQKFNAGRKLTVIDVGCGAGYKTVHVLSKEFRTIGVETEPALSFLRKTYPDLVWIESGKPEESLPEDANLGICDLGLLSDVIEHMHEPDLLLDYLKKLNCKLYVISTPKRECNNMTGPPVNLNHVREWTFHEFQLYLEFQDFEVVKSFDGTTTLQGMMHIVRVKK